MTSRGPWQVLSSEVKYENPWISVREDKVIHPDGKPGIFGVVTMAAGVTILALDDAGRVYLVELDRYATGTRSFELPGGAIDAGETPLEAAKRELQEEVGLEAATWTPLGGEFDAYTTTLTCPQRLFLATGLTDVGKVDDPNEPMTIHPVPLDEAIVMIQDGRITEPFCATALLLAARR
ncbi:MAG: NUDIX domain-containing protein [Patescibacteria group bacterium]|jgi:8-oxo-dGTP pyrophosphatase MutT (NUDIX family)